MKEAVEGQSVPLGPGWLVRDRTFDDGHIVAFWAQRLAVVSPTHVVHAHKLCVASDRPMVCSTDTTCVRPAQLCRTHGPPVLLVRGFWKSDLGGAAKSDLGRAAGSSKVHCGGEDTLRVKITAFLRAFGLPVCTLGPAMYLRAPFACLESKPTAVFSFAKPSPRWHLRTLFACAQPAFPARRGCFASIGFGPLEHTMR